MKHVLVVISSNSWLLPSHGQPFHTPVREGLPTNQELRRGGLNQTPDRPAGFTDFPQLAAILLFSRIIQSSAPVWLRKRGQITLVFDPTQRVPDHVLNAIIDEWLVPSLVEEFSAELRARGILRTCPRINLPTRRQQIEIAGHTSMHRH